MSFNLHQDDICNYFVPHREFIIKVKKKLPIDWLKPSRPPSAEVKIPIISDSENTNLPEKPIKPINFPGIQNVMELLRLSPYLLNLIAVAFKCVYAQKDRANTILSLLQKQFMFLEMIEHLYASNTNHHVETLFEYFSKESKNEFELLSLCHGNKFFDIKKPKFQEQVFSIKYQDLLRAFASLNESQFRMLPVLLFSTQETISVDSKIAKQLKSLNPNNLDYQAAIEKIIILSNDYKNYLKKINENQQLFIAFKNL